MPTYTYKCTACEDVTEKRQSYSDAPLTTCERCGGALRKVIHPVGIVFKGSGWYITDSRSSASSSVNGRGSASDSESKPAASESKESKESSASTKESSTSTRESSASSSSSTAKTPASEGA